MTPLRQRMLDERQRCNYTPRHDSRLYSRHQGFRRVPRQVSRTDGCRRSTRISAVHDPREEARARHGRASRISVAALSPAAGRQYRYLLGWDAEEIAYVGELAIVDKQRVPAKARALGENDTLRIPCQFHVGKDLI